jgi:hypothetical protein
MSGLRINLKIHVDTCQKPTATIVFWEIAPKPYADKIWHTMDSHWNQVTISP